MSIAVARERALEIADCLAGMGPIAVSRFFGGAALLADGVQFGFVMKGSLFLRVDDFSRADFEAFGSVPFAYHGRSKEVRVASYYEAPSEVVDDPAELIRWAARAHASALAARRGQARKGAGALQRRRNARAPQHRRQPRPR